MAQILSQDEVDALLNAVGDSNSDVNQEVGASAKDIKPYDLTNQDRVIRGRMPVLEIIYERFIRAFRVSFSLSLRKVSTISMISSDLLKFGEFVNTLPVPSCMYILKFNELRGPALVIFESKLAYGILDAYFGGSDRQYSRSSDKEFTSIELAIMKRVVDIVITDLEEAWAPVYKIDAQYLRSEINPQFVGIIPPSEVILVATFEVEFESTTGNMTIVIPYSTIEPIKQKLSVNYQIEKDMMDSAWVKILEDHLSEIRCDIIAGLGSSEITIGDLITMQKGDIIPLNQDADGDISVYIEGVEKFKTMMGTYKGNKAIQIVKLLK